MTPLLGAEFADFWYTNSQMPSANCTLTIICGRFVWSRSIISYKLARKFSNTSCQKVLTSALDLSSGNGSVYMCTGCIYCILASPLDQWRNFAAGCLWARGGWVSHWYKKRLCKVQNIQGSNEREPCGVGSRGLLKCPCGVQGQSLWWGSRGQSPWKLALPSSLVEGAPK